MNQKDFLKQFISNFITDPNNRNFNAILDSLADEAQRLQNLSIAVNDQLSISTSTGVYTDKLLADLGITRPAELGMEELAFKQMGIQINAAKQITESLHAVLATFYGDETVRANTTSTQAGPYALANGDELVFTLENGEILTLTLTSDQFENIQTAQTEEVVDVITRYIRGLGYNGYAQVYTDPDTGGKHVRIYGGAKGPYGFIQILGGQVQNQLEFPEIRGTELISNTTVWEITRNVGDRHRFRWASGPQPLLDKVFIGDKVLIYGNQFAGVGISGTFEVLAVRPSQSIPSYDSGYFEIALPEFTTLKSSTPDIAPPPNGPGTTYTITLTQNDFDDLKFFLPKKNTAYGQPRYALAWEPSVSKLKVYMPATTRVVKRDLVGSAHMHLNYANTDFNGAWGSATVLDSKIVVLSDRSFKYRQAGGDNLGYGGTVQYGISTYGIEYIYREGGWTHIVLTQPHALPSTPDSFGNLISNAVVTVNVTTAPEDDRSNPFLGPYVVDPEAPYTLTNYFAKTREKVLAGESRGTLVVTGQLPNTPGMLMLGLNTDQQESGLRYYAAQSSGSTAPIAISTISQVGTVVTVTTAQAHGLVPLQSVTVTGTVNFNNTWQITDVPSSNTFRFSKTPSAVIFESVGSVTPILNNAITTLILDPSYIFDFTHEIGEDITLISDDRAQEPLPDGSDYGLYITGTADGRVFAQELMQQITAAGIQQLEFVIIYPNDIGLGNEGGSSGATVPVSDKTYVWGT